MAGLRIRSMAAHEVALALDWAAAEGWNPGLADAGPFACVDPEGFLIGELDGAPASIIAVVNYDARFAFLGFYIVRPDLRGRGFGFRIWQAGHRACRARARSASTASWRSRTTTASPGSRSPMTTSATAARCRLSLRGGCDRAAVGIAVRRPSPRDDATVFPAARPAFLRAWLAAPGHVGRALMRDGRLAAWGVIRPCRGGRKIGPLVADDRAAAEAVFAALPRRRGRRGVSRRAAAEPRGHRAGRGAWPRAGVSDRADVFRRDPRRGARTGVRRDDVRAGLNVRGHGSALSARGRSSIIRATIAKGPSVMRRLMSVMSGLMLAAGLVLVCAPPVSAQTALEGSWNATRAERDGKAADDVVGHRLAFAGKRFEIRSNDGKTLYAAPQNRPAREAGGHRLREHARRRQGAGVAGHLHARRRHADHLRQCAESRKRRPAAFEAKRASGYVLVTFARARQP